MIDSLCDFEGREGAVVTGMYCDYLSQQEQTVVNVMGAILKQLVGRGDMPEFVREAFQAGKSNFGGRGPQLPDPMRMLKIAIASLPQVFILTPWMNAYRSMYQSFSSRWEIWFGNHLRCEYSSPEGPMSREISEDISPKSL